MSKITFIDIYGITHSLNILPSSGQKNSGQDGFDHFTIVNGGIDIIGKINYMKVSNLFINKVSGEVKTQLSLGPCKFPLIGNLQK